MFGMFEMKAMGDYHGLYLKTDFLLLAEVKIVCMVDLEYPDELHGLHNDYPLVPEKLEIGHGIL